METDTGDAIHTIAADYAHETVINKSRFICALARATSEDAARDLITARRKLHYDANHNCTAYVLGDAGEIARSSDDGEPAGTAGMPMLDVLRHREITNTVAVVTRYFGGVKLGAGGLVRAYGGAVAAALDAAGTVELRRLSVVTVVADYGFAGRLEADLHNSEWPVLDVRFGNDVAVDVAVADVGEFTAWLNAQTGGEAKADITGTTVIEH